MDYGGRRGEKKVETWQVVREIYWCEKNNKNKLHMYLLTCGIKLMYTLSFTFEGNYGTNLKALLECMNKQYFFPFYTKIKKKKVKLQNLIFFVISVWLDDFPFFLSLGSNVEPKVRPIHIKQPSLKNLSSAHLITFGS